MMFASFFAPWSTIFIIVCVILPNFMEGNPTSRDPYRWRYDDGEDHHHPPPKIAYRFRVINKDGHQEFGLKWRYEIANIVLKIIIAIVATYTYLKIKKG